MWPQAAVLQSNMASASRVKRNYLTLEKKVELIKYAEKHPKVGVRELGEVFKCGKTQVGCALKNKERLLEMFESNKSKTMIHTGAPWFSEVNKALYDWYVIACSKNI